MSQIDTSCMYSDAIFSVLLQRRSCEWSSIHFEVPIVCSSDSNIAFLFPLTSRTLILPYTCDSIRGYIRTLKRLYLAE